MLESPAGRVLGVHRYPLKSADGESLDRVDVGSAGLAEDRRWALARGDGSPVTAREAPDLRRVRASAADGELRVRVGEGEPVCGPAAASALAALVGGDVRLVDAAGEHQQVAAVHLVSAGAAAADDAPSGCDPQPRANLVLDLPLPGAERGWVGRRVRLGEVELRVTRTPERCLGVYAEVLVPGRVETGDEVQLLED